MEGVASLLAELAGSDEGDDERMLVSLRATLEQGPPPPLPLPRHHRSPPAVATSGCV